MTRSDRQIPDLVHEMHKVFEAPVHQQERHAALRCLIDSLGCGIAGATDSLGVALLESYKHSSSTVLGQAATVFGFGVQLPVFDALLVNAALIRARDFNDVYSGRNNHHPSESVIPMSLALAENEQWSGSQLLDAVARGYRISLVVGELWSGLLDRGWAPAATLGHVANTILLGLLRNTNPDVLSNAVAISAVTSPILAVVFKGDMSDLKSMVSGLALQNSWRSLALAAQGLTGPLNALEGTAGFNQQIGGEPLAIADALELGLDARSVALKPYPTIFTIHSALEAAIEIRNQIGDLADREIRSGDITIQVTVPPKVKKMAAAPEKWSPQNKEEAQFSLPHALCAALLFGKLSIQTLEASLEQNNAPAMDQLKSQLQVDESEEWGGYVGARVTVTSGSHTWEVVIDSPLGSKNNAFTDEQVSNKFVDLVEPVMGLDASLEAVKALWNLENMADFRAVRSIMISSSPGGR